MSDFKSDKVMRHLQGPSIINSESKTWKITRKNVELLQNCNHEEADTRMIHHLAQEQSSTVVVVKGTDTLIYLLYTKSQNLKDMSWFIKINANDYIKADTINQTFWYEMYSLLLQFHAITGIDATSYKIGRLAEEKQESLKN